MGSSSTIARLTVQSEPPIHDPRELHTILVFSLRSLWGELESHSYGVQVTECNSTGNLVTESSSNKSNQLVVVCPIASMPAVRAALTMVTPPPYLEDTAYQFDVLNIETEPLLP